MAVECVNARPPEVQRLSTTRRKFIAGVGTLVTSAMLPTVASAAGTRDPRLIVVVLRGGLDGLNAVPPAGDPHYSLARPDIRLRASGDLAALPLDELFMLNPALRHLHAMFGRREALIIQAVATPYRERSHFDGQDILESGAPTPRSLRTGWLNRLLSELPTNGRSKAVEGLAAGASVPLILQGPAPTLSWTPGRFSGARSDTIERLIALYGARDPELADLIVRGSGIDRLTSGSAAGVVTQDLNRTQRSFAELATGAGRLLASAEGPRVASICYDGWDTHVNEGAATGRLANLLTGLDAALESLRVELASVWRQTAVVVITEFGRTVVENGTDGTDHGTGTVAFLVGGAVRGGRVRGEWPGLAPRELLDGRDLRPTCDLRSVLKGVLIQHLDLGISAISHIFPGSEHVLPMQDLIG